MATQKVCDGCGKAENDAGGLFGVQVNVTDFDSKNRDYDLCEPCLDDFKPVRRRTRKKGK